MEQLIKPDGLYINLLDRPVYYNTKVLPAELKQQVVNEYHKFYTWAEKKQIPQSVIEQFKECEHYMLSEDLSKQWPLFLKETKLIDTMRDENNVFGFDCI
jgi:dimeric dUTPase (all-alpha-NTP-PPase superfamily)